MRKTIRVHSPTWLGGVVLALAAMPAAALPTYAYQALTMAGATEAHAQAVNDAGQVAGQAFSGTRIDGVRWSAAGTGTWLSGPAGSIASGAYAINAAGQVAGTYYVGLGRYQDRGIVWNGDGSSTPIGDVYRVVGLNDAGAAAAVGPDLGFFSGALGWQDGVTRSLGSLGGAVGQAYAINNAGWISGWTEDADGRSHTVIWTPAGIVDLGMFGPATAINDRGQVAGENGSTVFLWGAATGMAVLDSLGGDAVTLGGINEAGDLVGASTLAGGGDLRATLWRDGAARDLNDLLAPGSLGDGWVLEQARDINNLGWIVGDAVNARTGQRTGFLLTPQADQAVEEPPGLALALLAFGLLAVFGARRRR